MNICLIFFSAQSKRQSFVSDMLYARVSKTHRNVQNLHLDPLIFYQTSHRALYQISERQDRPLHVKWVFQIIFQIQPS